MVLVSRERQCLGGSALSMTVRPSDNKAEHINITIAKTHNITNWPIRRNRPIGLLITCGLANSMLQGHANKIPEFMPGPDFGVRARAVLYHKVILPHLASS